MSNVVAERARMTEIDHVSLFGPILCRTRCLKCGGFPDDLSGLPPVTLSRSLLPTLGKT
jgi:hypothetical protein